MAGFAVLRPDIISSHKSKTPWCILNSDCSLGLTKLQIKKMCKMAILGQKWSFLAFLRGLHGVTWPVTLAYQSSTHLPHNIKKSAQTG